MKFEKKLIILSGGSFAKGTLNLERNSFGTFATFNVYNLPDLNDGEYSAGIKNSELTFKRQLGNLGRVLMRFKIDDIELENVHCVIYDTISQEPLLYGTNAPEKLWDGNMMDGFREKRTDNTVATQAVTHASGDIGGYFLDILQRGESGYCDSAVAAVNYYPKDMNIEITYSGRAEQPPVLNPLDEAVRKRNNQPAIDESDCRKDDIKMKSDKADYNQSDDETISNAMDCSQDKTAAESDAKYYRQDKTETEPYPMDCKQSKAETELNATMNCIEKTVPTPEKQSELKSEKEHKPAMEDETKTAIKAQPKTEIKDIPKTETEIETEFKTAADTQMETENTKVYNDSVSAQRSESLYQRNNAEFLEAQKTVSEKVFDDNEIRNKMNEKTVHKELYGKTLDDRISNEQPVNNEQINEKYINQKRENGTEGVVPVREPISLRKPVACETDGGADFVIFEPPLNGNNFAGSRNGDGSVKTKDIEYENKAYRTQTAAAEYKKERQMNFAEPDSLRNSANRTAEQTANQSNNSSHYEMKQTTQTNAMNKNANPSVLKDEKMPHSEYDEHMNIKQVNQNWQPQSKPINEMHRNTMPVETVQVRTAGSSMSEAAATVPPASRYTADKAVNSAVTKVIFYEMVKTQIDELFASYPPFEQLEKMMPDTKWVKVDYDGNGKYYVVGLIGANPDYLCYGVPSRYSPEPPKDLDGYCQWLPLDAKTPEGEGFWLMFQDAVSGESVSSG